MYKTFPKRARQKKMCKFILWFLHIRRCVNIYTIQRQVKTNYRKKTQDDLTVVIINIIIKMTENKVLPFNSHLPQVLVCFQSIITIKKHFGNRSYTYSNKYDNKYDYLHVWFIGCVCFGVFTISFTFNVGTEHHGTDNSQNDLYISFTGHITCPNNPFWLENCQIITYIAQFINLYAVNKELCCIVDKYF